MPDHVRVLFIGQTGVNLKWSVRRLAEFCRKEEFKLEGKSLTELGNSAIAVHFIEELLPLQPYLDLDNILKQQEMWHDAMATIVAEINENKSKNYFLGMNLPHYRKDKFFPVPDIDLIKQFSPDIIITLIDDVHTCYERIKKRQKTRSIFSLKDILVWRSVSIYVGDILTHAMQSVTKKDVQNFVVAVKHPPSMFQKLIFHQDIIRSYCSFSITGVRDDPPKKNKVNEFRKQMHDHFCIFDPLTIDDRLVQNTYAKASGLSPNDKISIDGRERWDLGQDFSLMPDLHSEDDPTSIFPIEIKVSEIQEIAEKKKLEEQGEDPSVIDNQIRERDFRLIDQSDTLVVFRPNIAGKISDGVTEEANYASQVNPKRWFYIWDDNEDGEIESGPFKPFVGKGIRYPNKEELIAYLTNNSKEIKEN